MKRSRVNEIIRQTEKLLSDNGYVLPPFLNWTPEEWQEKSHECDEIRDNALGWDVTDFGTGDFDHIGLTAVTLRNGNQKDPARYPKPYAEKYLVAREGQHTPMHFHTYKMEDIINRGGGILVMQLYCANEKDELDLEKPVEIVSDGRIRVRTYERGVEAETLACGTGATASALAAAVRSGSDCRNYRVDVEGGVLFVSFERTGDERFTNVTLTGPAQKVFEGCLAEKF